MESITKLKGNPGAGRPVGSVKVLDNLVKQELEHSMKINKRIRKNIEETLARIEKLGKTKPDDLAAQLLILKGLETVATSSAKAFESLAKHSQEIQDITGDKNKPSTPLDAPSRSSSELLADLEKDGA